MIRRERWLKMGTKIEAERMNGLTATVRADTIKVKMYSTEGKIHM